MTDLVFLDTETTGLNPERAVVWEIGMVAGEEEFSWILELEDDEIALAEGMALSVGGYYQRAGKARDEFVGDASRLGYDATKSDSILAIGYIPIHLRRSLADIIVRTVGTAHIVGAVPGFDDRFLGDFLRRYDRPPSWHYHLVDVEALAAGKLGLQPPWKSKDLYRELGLNSSYFDEHTALGDARMAKAVYELVFNLPPSWPDALLLES